MTLTPLVDVVFILLVFFMLATSFAHERRLVLTAATAPPGAAAAVRDVSHVLVGSAAVRLGGQPLPLDELVAEVARRAATPSHRVLVQPTADASLQVLVDVLAALRRAGVQRIDVASR
ncbi:MAG: ExbD/TolR family protein [Alphaproteobacteria bacterium]